MNRIAVFLALLIAQTLAGELTVSQDGDHLKVAIDGDFGLLTANPFGPQAYRDETFSGKGDILLKHGETLTLRYRLLLHQGGLASAKLDERWAEMNRAGGLYPGDFGNKPIQQAEKKLTVLALGDSITAGGKGYPTYRQFLAPELAELGLSFIGPMRDAYSAHAGYGGRNSSFLLKKIGDIYNKYPADFVLLHSGHNHFAKDNPVPQILKDTKAIVRAIHEMNPKTVVLIAQPITAGKLPKYSYLPKLNRELPGLIKKLKQEGLPVQLVDQATGFDWHHDTLPDKVHPNNKGARKMAEAWLETLEPLASDESPSWQTAQP
jgi:lysophospholipase L1-like esterase